MDFSYTDKIQYIAKVLEENNLSAADMTDFFYRPLTPSRKILNSSAKRGPVYSSIISAFVPTMEKISPDDINGLNFEATTIIDALVEIYRFDSLYGNLGNFDREKYKKSIENTDFFLVEKDGKYYVNHDGNHRALLMLFQYNLEIKKAENLGAPRFVIEGIKKDLQIDVPIIHLRHDPDFLNYIKTIDEETSKRTADRGGLQGEFMCSFLPEDAHRDFFIQFNKDNETYNAFYKGFVFKDKSDSDIANCINNVDSYNLKNDYLKYDQNKFAISQKHLGMCGIPSDKILKIDNLVSQLQFPEMTFDYFVKNDYPQKTFSIVIEGQDYGSENIDFAAVDTFVDDNADILFSNRTDGLDAIITEQNFLNSMHFTNLSFEQMMKVLKTVKELDDLITYTQKRNSKPKY